MVMDRRIRPRPRLSTMTFPSSPVYEDLFHRRANVQLKILVVGASLSGLSAAYNLKQAGHDVRVLEKSNGKLNFCAGARVPPNMAKLLQHWGIGEKLKQKSLTCPRVDFFNDITGQFLSTVVYHNELMKELQADIHDLPYADLYDMIRDLTLRSGVKIDYNLNVVDVDVDGPSVSLANGQTINADLIVGADGSQSIVREKLVGFKEECDAASPTSHYYLIPVSKLKGDPLLAPLLEDGRWRMWMGDMRCILGYRAGKEQYAMCVIVPKTSIRPGWTETIPLAQLDYPDAHETLRRLLAHGDRAIEMQSIHQPPLESWYSDSGKIVLVGRSVHTSKAGSTYETSLCVEDGAVLGSLFSRLQSRRQDEITRLLAAYQEIRQERSESIIRTDEELLLLCTMPPGPARDQRNAGFAVTSQNQALDWDNSDESVLRSAWEAFRTSFGYEAYDAADDWWIDWGVMVYRTAAAGNSEDTARDDFRSSGIGTSVLDGLQTQTVVTAIDD